MAKNINHLQLLRSNSVISGIPQSPNPSSLTDGELAVNYAKDHETIFLKNSQNEIVAVSSDDVYTTNKLGALFGDSASTVTGVFSAHSGDTVSGLTSSQKHLPQVTASDDRKVLMVVDGEWQLVRPVTLFTGNNAPSPSQGIDGDLYLQTS